MATISLDWHDPRRRKSGRRGHGRQLRRRPPRAPGTRPPRAGWPTGGRPAVAVTFDPPPPPRAAPRFRPAPASLDHDPAVGTAPARPARTTSSSSADQPGAARTQPGGVLRGHPLRLSGREGGRRGVRLPFRPRPTRTNETLRRLCVGEQARVRGGRRSCTQGRAGVEQPRHSAAIVGGDVALAAELLGRPYRIEGTVVRGEAAGGQSASRRRTSTASRPCCRATASTRCVHDVVENLASGGQRRPEPDLRRGRPQGRGPPDRLLGRPLRSLIAVEFIARLRDTCSFASVVRTDRSTETGHRGSQSVLDRCR